MDPFAQVRGPQPQIVKQMPLFLTDQRRAHPRLLPVILDIKDRGGGRVDEGRRYWRRQRS
ncbi:hypothetical protein SAMN04488239_115106 [Ruegeria marina]|uniref:Uncharacterized protein n=1 Tax=Ruegeria marina TaxID=639004 RepID=A0A1G7AZB1_9RHOB|nr:hypothetical protein SAMN04488239_115106 [Ruegeria marina]